MVLYMYQETMGAVLRRLLMRQKMIQIVYWKQKRHMPSAGPWKSSLMRNILLMVLWVSPTLILIDNVYPPAVSNMISWTNRVARNMLIRKVHKLHQHEICRTCKYSYG